MITLKKKNLVVLALLFLQGSVNATLPLRIPEDDWSALSAVLRNKKLPASWRDEHGHSRIYFQLTYGSEELAIRYIREDPSCVNRFEGGVPLIIHAVLAGSQSVVKELVKKGANVTGISPQAESPLMFAAGEGHLEIMRTLLAAKADIGFTTAAGMDAMRRALIGGKINSVNLLIDYGYDLERKRNEHFQGNLLFDAISGNSYRAVSLLINSGFDVNQKNETGETPLSFAGKNQASGRIVELLLETGASP